MAVFGENLKRIRMEHKMTQDEFAELLNTSKQVISRYENGQRSPKVSVVAEYARRLHVPIASLTGDAVSSRPDSVEETDKDNRLWAKREALRRDPRRRILFDLAENGTEKDIDAAVALIDALKKTNPDFYDGDDPA